MKKIKNIAVVALVVLGCGALIYGVSDDGKNTVTRHGLSRYFPVSIDFAGEAVPLQVTDVKERFDRELLVNVNLDATTLLVLKRANRAFPIIEPILKKNG